MKKLFYALIAASLGLAQIVHAIPSEITYQGTLKHKNLPAKGDYNLLFRITNQDGTQVYWSSGNQLVTVINGLFAARLSPSGVDWENVTPYIEVSIEGQILLPREPVRTTVYATLSGSVIDSAITTPKLNDGSVTTPKLDPRVQQYLVPAGAVMLFAGPCPADWTRFTALDNNFPMGSATYGTTGGSATHAHSINIDGAHNHGGQTGTPSGTLPSNAGANFLSVTPNHTHPITTAGAHNHNGFTGTASNLPPFLNVVFCQKN